jgi:MFS family permease
MDPAHPALPSRPVARALLAALVIVAALPALDQGIMSTAMPRAAASLGRLDLYPWIATGYLLASTVMMPIFGKACDIWGRRPILVLGLVVFGLGSALCGLAGWGAACPAGVAMGQLIGARIVQGFGGAALIAASLTAAADLFTPRERARIGGLFASVLGVASLMGPTVGGLLSDLPALNLFGVAVRGWRWAFYVNLPLALLALALVLVRFPGGGGRPASLKLDLLGAGVLIAAVLPLFLALGDGAGGWSSAGRWSLMALAGAGLAAFVWVERRAADPIIALGAFGRPVFAAANLAGFVLFMALVGVVSFLPLHMQLGRGLNGAASGLAMVPLTLGLIVSATWSGRIVARTGRYKPVLALGCALFSLAALSLSRIGELRTAFDVAWRLGLLGVGLGPIQGLLTLAIQNEAPARDLGAVTGASQFLRQLGLSVGLAVFGGVLAAGLPGGGGAMTTLRAAEIRGGGIDPVIGGRVSRAVATVVAGGFGLSLLGLACAFLVPSLPLGPGLAAPNGAPSRLPSRTEARPLGAPSAARSRGKRNKIDAPASGATPGGV